MSLIGIIASSKFIDTSVKIIALGDSSNTISRSSDGITYTTATLPATGAWTSGAYGDKWFIVDNTNQNGATSTDGITWTTRSLSSSTTWYASAYGGGTYVATATGGTTASSSTDAISWTGRTLPSS